LTKLGQELFNPPNVGGWGDNSYWVSTYSSLTQLDFAQVAVGLADMSAIEDEAPRARVAALANLLGIRRWTKGTATALNAAIYQPPTLAALAFVSPEYLAN